ncbi:hypothetical protein [Cryobacterium sp. AP23]
MIKNTRRLRMAAGVGGLAVLVAAVIGIALTTPPSGTAVTAGSSTAPSERGIETPPADTSTGLPSSGLQSPSAVPSAAPEDAAGPTPGPAAPAPTPSPDASVDTPPDAAAETPLEPATEIPPAEADVAEPEPNLPPSTPIPSLLTGPLPDSATAENKVVDGFPAGIPVATRSTVSTSDVTVDNERVRASLTATTPTAGIDVLAQYDAAFSTYGFYSADTPAVGGSTAREYNRGAESVTVTVTPSDSGGSGYSILALLVAPE